MRIALIGGARFGVGEPFAGGLERHTAILATSLQRLGHDVIVFAGPADASTPAHLRVRPVTAASPGLAGGGDLRLDTAVSPERCVAEHDGYRRVLAEIVEGDFDIVHNNSLHYLPVLADGHVGVPMVHTLHTPPFDWLARAHRVRRRNGGDRRALVAVSRSLAGQWHLPGSNVVVNGIDLTGWPVGGGRPGRCAWVGRIVPEKAPHLAIDAARLAGREIVLAGPVYDPGYFRREVRPRLGPSARWLGHRPTAELARWCGQAEVGLVTPCWEEPFGLVAVEFLASGTPVAGLRRGALPEIVDPSVGALAPEATAAELAQAIELAATVDRKVCRKTAEARFSATDMAARYVDLYRQLRRRDGSR